MPIRRFDDNVYSRLEFLKAVSHNSELHTVTDATDSDSNSPDDDKQALMPTLQPYCAATVNTTYTSAMDGIYFVKTLRLCMLSNCLTSSLRLTRYRHAC